MSVKPKRYENMWEKNQNGGIYQRGRSYDFRDKLRVAEMIEDEEKRSFPKRPCILNIARRAQVSKKFVYKILEELEVNGAVKDPPFNKTSREGQNICRKVSKVQETFLLAARAENPGRTNLEYVFLLKQTFDVEVSSTSISDFFLKRFPKQGKFKVPTLVPLDKFKEGNKARYFEFLSKVNLLNDHARWLFFDEKHLVNSDTIRSKVRANPYTGYVDAIGVSGDFRESYNLLAAVTVNALKGRPMVYTIGKDNGDSECFMFFIRGLIMSGWLWHGDVLCMDNSRVHTGGACTELQHLLWNYERDGRPLRILVVFLPTRAPELNPIELVFHILARRIQSRRNATGMSPCDQAVVKYAMDVMQNMTFTTIVNCYKHCGY